MPEYYGVNYMVVGKVRSPSGFSRDLLCTKQPTIQQMNFMYLLCKHVSRIIDMDDLCYQLKCSPNAVRVIATHIRKILHYHWSIESVSNRGIRMSYIGGALSDADFTYLEFNPEMLVRTRNRETPQKRVRRISFRVMNKPVRAKLEEDLNIDPVIIPVTNTVRTRARL
jgi:hypothetical protein